MILGLTAATDRRFVEGLLIVCVGLCIHILKISVMPDQNPQSLETGPDAASTLFVLSMLCILVKMRPSWTAELGQLQRFLFSLVELSTILFLTECAIRYIWPIPANMVRKVPGMSSWLGKDVYALRLQFAFLIFIFMLKITGTCDYLRSLVYESGVNGDNEDMVRSSNEDTERSLRLGKLRPVPPVDILTHCARLRSLRCRGKRHNAQI